MTTYTTWFWNFDDIKYRFMGHAENSALASQKIVFQTEKGYSLHWGISTDNSSVNNSSFSNQTNSGIYMQWIWYSLGNSIVLLSNLVVKAFSKHVEQEQSRPLKYENVSGIRNNFKCYVERKQQYSQPLYGMKTGVKCF